MKKVKFLEKGSKRSKESKGVSLVVTYHPTLNCLSRIIKDNLNILYMSCEAKAVFLPDPMVLFRSVHKISSYLMRAKLYPLERFVGSRQHEKCRCKVFTNVIETYPF